MHTDSHEEYSMSKTNHYGAYPSPGAQSTDKTHELGSDDDVEGRDEKKMSSTEEAAAHKASSLVTSA